ncbi:MAG: hypothetical protein SGJ27_22190 [Candidatus Melainabacteria bacterium]|nr:hypothetical protein [Candidatus Melainabacteria bacterium]
MNNNDKNVRHNMIKRVEAKDDGRVLIYYTFESSDDIEHKESLRKETDKGAQPKGLGD